MTGKGQQKKKKKKDKNAEIQINYFVGNLCSSGIQ